MSEFSASFIDAITQYGIGKKIVRVEAEGTYADQKDHWIHLDDGTRITFRTGTSGLDSDSFYSFQVLDQNGDELRSDRRYPPTNYPEVHPELTLIDSETPPTRSGFERALQQKIASAYFGDGCLGVGLETGAYMVSRSAGYLLHATWLYESTGDQAFIAVAKTITGEWTQGGGFGLSMSESDKTC